MIAFVLVAAIAASCFQSGWTHVATASASPSIPPAVSTAVWRTELPEEVSQVAPGGPGLFALQGDGVIAIDAATGDVAWEYREPGATAMAVVARPNARSALLVTSTNGVLEIVGLDATTGDEMFVLPYTQPDYASPTLHIGLTTDAFVLITDHQSVRGFGLDTGGELWVAPMPENCSEIVSWFGNYQTTRSGVVVPCAGFGQGGFAFLDTRLGEFTWSDVRTDLIGDTLAAPEVSPDGMTVHVRFLAVGPGRGFITESAILDVETGRALSESDRFLGRLGFDGTWLHLGELIESGTVLLEDLRTGQETTIAQPCNRAKPLIVLPTGVLWLKSDRLIGEEVGDDPCQFVFTPTDGEQTDISIDFDFWRPPRVVVAAGTIVLAEGSTVFGLR